MTFCAKAELSKVSMSFNLNWKLFYSQSESFSKVYRVCQNVHASVLQTYKARKPHLPYYLPISEGCGTVE